MAGHKKVYGVCENKCLVEVLPKEQAATKEVVAEINQLLDYINIEIDYSWKTDSDSENNFFINKIKHSSNEWVDVDVDLNNGYLTFYPKSSFESKDKMFTVVGQFKDYITNNPDIYGGYYVMINPSDYGLPASGQGLFNLSVAVFGKPSDFVPVA